MSSEKNYRQQQTVLKKLLANAKNSAFGKQYSFSEILTGDIVRQFQQQVPIHTYLEMKPWWMRALKGESDIVTKGRLKYFALSSGTSDDTTKYVPVSNAQTIQFKRQSVKLSIRIALNKNIPATVFSKHHLLIGGSMDLNYDGVSYTGDLSGITQLKIPFWYQPFSKPGRNVMRMKWDEKIEHIVQDAPKWNVSIITGVPSWVQIILEKIIARYSLKNIHDLWPELKVYIHSGIRAEPYFNSINKLFGQKVYWYETYLASEGFFAFKQNDNSEGMKLILSDNNFFEFIPFNDDNFDENGNLKEHTLALTIKEIQPNVDYALLISTCSGAWRYMIGDTVKFTDTEKAEIVVSGRTKHFLSVTGEHLSVDNMNKAIEEVSAKLGFICKEFTVYAENKNAVFRHVWFIGCDTNTDNALLTTLLDETLSKLNDDYRIERAHALHTPKVNTVPNETFYKFLKIRGKEGGQVKFPRVIKGELQNAWQNFVV